MDNELLDKLDDVIKAFENSKEIKRYLFLKDKLLKDDDLIKKINLIKNEKYGNNYIRYKEEVLSNEYYKEYIELEKRLYFLLQNINKKLSTMKG